jgi:hypothetical protein
MRQLPMSGQGFAQPGQGWLQGISSELPAIAVMSDLTDASAIPAGMATNAISMARTPSATDQRCRDLFTRAECHSGALATRKGLPLCLRSLGQPCLDQLREVRLEASFGFGPDALHAGVPAGCGWSECTYGYRAAE